METALEGFEAKLAGLPESGAYILFKGEAIGKWWTRVAAAFQHLLPPSPPVAHRLPTPSAAFMHPQAHAPPTVHLPAAEWCSDCARSTQAVRSAVAAVGGQLLEVDVGMPPGGVQV